MKSGKMTSKPSDMHRKNLNRRAIKTMIQSGRPVGRLTDAEKKTPSQKHSESMRKKLRQKADKIVVVSNEEFEKRVKK